jgi:hypothetical protein
LTSVFHSAFTTSAITAIGQGDPVGHGKAVFIGKEVGSQALFLIRSVTPEWPDVGIRRILPPPLTKPIIGGIEGDIRSNAGK